MSRVATLALLAFSVGCSKPSTPREAPTPGPELVATCTVQASAVRTLYQRALGPRPREEKEATLYDEQLEANVQMVLSDCAREPVLRAACLRRATSVTDLETECVERPDDRGAVEALQFGS